MMQFVEIHDVEHAINRIYIKWMGDMLEDKEDEQTLFEVLQDVVSEIEKLKRYA